MGDDSPVEVEVLVNRDSVGVLMRDFSRRRWGSRWRISDSLNEMAAGRGWLVEVTVLVKRDGWKS